MIINGDGVYLGAGNINNPESGSHPATYADELVNVLNQLCGVLELTAIAAGANPYTMALQMPLNKIANVKKLIPNIESPHVKIG